jgi:23S rRNA (cytosine1962-C5)-methyltransferase
VHSTYVKTEAARRLRRGFSWVRREDIVRIDGRPDVGEPVQLVDEQGEPLGIGDLDLEAEVAVRRLGLPEEAAHGIIQRHLRHAIERRGHLVEDPRFCRAVNDDGDGLPGLVVDRYEGHFVAQSFTRAMDARVKEIARSLVELGVARSVLLRNDDPRRQGVGLPLAKPHVLHGTPPRWTRLSELNARYTVDLYGSSRTHFAYGHRELRRVVGRLAFGERVLDARCGLGGLFIEAGLHGARKILAFESDADAAELARENAEANGLQGKVKVEELEPEGDLPKLRDTFDLVLLELPEPFEAAQRLLRGCVRATRHAGKLVLAAEPRAPWPETLDAMLSRVCEEQGRVAYRLARASLPPDFPTVVGAREGELFEGLAVEIS